MLKSTHNYRLALIGHPVAHSRSPEIYEKLFSEYGVTGSFHLVDMPIITRNGLSDIVHQMSLDAFAITMPHKKTIIPMLHGLTERAESIQSVNFVKVSHSDGSLSFVGDSTDGDGFIRGLLSMGINCALKTVVIYGSGGAAASVAYSLSESGASVFIAARNSDAAKSLSKRLNVNVIKSLTDMPDCDMFINATPLGMCGFGVDYSDFGFLDKLNDAIVCDLIYDPLETTLLRYAKERGHITVNGIKMLEEQARIAFSSLISN